MRPLRSSQTKIRQARSTVRKQRNEPKRATRRDGNPLREFHEFFGTVGCNQTGRASELIEIRKHDDPRSRTQGTDACQPGRRRGFAPRAARPIEPPFACLLQRQTRENWEGRSRGGGSGSGGGIRDPPRATYVWSRRGADALVTCRLALPD